MSIPASLPEQRSASAAMSAGTGRAVADHARPRPATRDEVPARCAPKFAADGQHLRQLSASAATGTTSVRVSTGYCLNIARLMVMAPLVATSGAWPSTRLWRPAPAPHCRPRRCGLDHDGEPGPPAEPVAGDTRQNVGCGPGRDRHHDPDRFRRQRLRRCRSAQGSAAAPSRICKALGMYPSGRHSIELYRTGAIVRSWCPVSEVRIPLQQSLTRTSETKGHQQLR